jgi:hypothetical protein
MCGLRRPYVGLPQHLGLGPSIYASTGDGDDSSLGVLSQRYGLTAGCRPRDGSHSLTSTWIPT